jgi:hypothetical protein
LAAQLVEGPCVPVEDQDPATIDVFVRDASSSGIEHGNTSILYDPLTGEIVSARVKVTSCYAPLLAHEFGHALGLGHTEENRIMRAGVDDSTAWEASEEERARVSR